MPSSTARMPFGVDMREYAGCAASSGVALRMLYAYAGSLGERLVVGRDIESGPMEECCLWQISQHA